MLGSIRLISYINRRHAIPLPQSKHTSHMQCNAIWRGGNEQEAYIELEI